MIAAALDCAAAMAGGTAFALGSLWFCLVAVPALAGAARLTARAVRLLFLAAGWAVAVARLLL